MKCILYSHYKVTSVWNLEIVTTILNLIINKLLFVLYFLGTNYVYGHASRAMYYRLARNKSPPKLGLPSGYQAVCPSVNSGSIENGWQDTERSSALSVVWTLGDSRVEVSDGTTGQLMYSER